MSFFFKQINQQNKFNSQKDYNTWTSQVVTHPSTAQVRRCLTTEIGLDPMFSS